MLCLFYVLFEYRLILCLFYVLFEYRLILCLFYVLFEYRLILCLFMLYICTDMYLKTAEVWLRTSRLGQIVFKIYSVEQLLLYCDLRDFYLLQSPPKPPLGCLTSYHSTVPYSLSRTLSATYQAPARIGYTISI